MRAHLGICIALALTLSGCEACEKLKGMGSGGSASGGTAEGTGGGASPNPGSGGAGCKLPADTNITKSWSIPENCSLTFPDGLSISEGGIITIGAGARLAFAGSKIFHIAKGHLIAKGTDKAPIVFTSAAKLPAPGDWVGLAFTHEVGAGNVLDHVIVEYAGNGQRFGTGIEAAVGVQDVQSGRVAITNSTFRKNKGTAIMANGDEVGSFVKVEGNIVEGSTKYSLDLVAGVLGSVGVNKLDKPVRVEGRVKTTQAWPKLDVPIIVGGMQVGAEKGEAVLTIAPGSILKVETNTELHTDARGGIVAKGVTFTSAATTPAPGDWVGISFDGQTTRAELDGSIVEFAGRPWGSGDTGVVVVWTPAALGKQVKVKGMVFRKNAGKGAIVAEGCPATAGKPDQANKSEGIPLCAAP